MRITLISLACMMGLAACQPNQTELESTESPIASAQTTHQISTLTPNTEVQAPLVAKIKGMPVAQSMVDESIQLKLYDLEWAKYELRRASLAQLVEQALKSGRVAGEDIEVLLVPPMPPRLTVSPDGQPQLGVADAPVTVSVFCSYQSSHCGRMQATYEELAELYAGQLRFVFYDYPQPFHRQGPEASFAARCAEALGRFEPFHKALWAQQNNLGTALYQRLAKQLNVDEKEFAACVDERRYLSRVKANTELAESFGFGNVPVTLINGLYLNGPKTVDTLRFFVDQELVRLGIEPGQALAAQETLQQSELPLRLEGVMLSDDASVSTAMIRHLGNDQIGSYRQDQNLEKDVFLVLIEADRVVIENQGQLEYLPLQTGGGEGGEMDMAQSDQSSPGTATLSNTSEESVDQQEEIPEEIRMAAESQGFTARPIVEAQGETPLSRAWLQQQLQNESALRAHFKPTELEVEGVHILKLRDVADNEFYQTLGLMEGDVVLRVNDEWVHEAQNNLFAHLETGQSVSVVLMRRGLPVHLKYAIN